MPQKLEFLPVLRTCDVGCTTDDSFSVFRVFGLRCKRLRDHLSVTGCLSEVVEQVSECLKVVFLAAGPALNIGHMRMM